MTSTTGLAPPPRGRWEPVFVGRRGELASVDAAWDEAAAGEPRVVAVEGPAGTGKTAFIARCVAARAGATVLSATGDEAEAALSHGLLDQLVAGLPPDLVARFPLLRSDRDARADPLAVGADLLGALGALPGEEPVLIALDDLQWADPASLRVLAFALRRLRHDRVVVLAGLRVPGSGPVEGTGPVEGADPATAPPGPPWERLLAAGRGVRRLRLEGLVPAELSELAAAVGRPLGSTGAAERLWRHTRGHPLHARTLLEELPSEVLAGTADVLPAPRSLRSVVLVRLSRGSPDAQALVVAASVLGEGCPVGLAAAVAGLDDPSAALDEAVRLGLLTERPGGPPVRVGFVHPLVRAAVRGDLPPGRRRELHRAAAVRLSGRAALDHRIAAAIGADAGLAAEIEVFVADPAARVGGAEAADLMRVAADLSTTPGDRERRLLLAVSRLLDDGEVARAAALEPDVEACAPGPRRSAVLGELALLTGRLAPARERLEAALAPAADGSAAEAGAGAGAADDPGDRADAVAAAHLAVLHLLQGDAARAVELAAVALAVPGQGDGVRLPAGLALVVGLAASGRGGDAQAVLDRGVALRGGVAPVDVLVVRGMLAALADDDAAAARDLEDAVRRARAGEPVRGLALALAFLPAVQDRIGTVDGVVEGLELAIAVARDGGTPVAGMLAHALAAEALAVRGRADEARAHLDAVRTGGPRWWGIEVCTAIAGAVLAELEDDPDAVLRALAPTREPAVRALTDGLGMFAPRVLEVDALLGAGRTAEAAAALTELDGLLAGRAPGRHAVDAARLRVRLTAATGGRPLRDPAAGLDAVAAPLALARLETEIGRHLLAAGERRAGVDLVRAARERVARLGAVPQLRRCEALLHGAGLTPAASASSGLSGSSSGSSSTGVASAVAPSGGEALGLTPHEEAVVALVARGLTNREVGRDLFITPRTVAYHLSNIYAKLGVTSRHQLRDLVAAPR